jgi:large subunit ribosomal protein L23
MKRRAEKKDKDQKDEKKGLTLSTERLYGVVRGPVITEKATRGSEHSQVTFRVALDASKPEIKAAIESLFGVKVRAVNTLRVEGKKKVSRGRRGQRSDFKKAIVTLEQGQTIDVTAGI